jgi:hypothetical protein
MTNKTRRDEYSSGFPAGFGGFENLEYPRQKRENREKSRVRVEHVFGFQTYVMGGGLDQDERDHAFSLPVWRGE